LLVSEVVHAASEASTTRGREIERRILWSLGGVCMSPLVGAPLWLLVRGQKVAGLVSFGAAVGGAVAGLVLASTAPRFVKLNGAKVFAAAYPATFGWWLALAGNQSVGLTLMAVTVVVAGLSFVGGKRLSRRTVSEVTKLGAAIIWVLAGLFMFLMFFGVVFVPLAAALTVVSRRSPVP
jgi:hypothetical protein